VYLAFALSSTFKLKTAISHGCYANSFVFCFVFSTIFMSIICDVSTVLHLGAFLLKQNKQTDILILQEIEFFFNV